MSANLSVEQSLMKAKSYSKKGDLAEAQKLYETILQNFSNNIRAQQGLASIKKHKQNNVIQNPPQESVSELVNLYNQGQMEAVIEQAEALTAQYPGAPVVWDILGASRAQIGMLDEAVEAYKKTISLKPDYADAYNNMGATFTKLGKLDEAIEAYKKSISLKPDYAEAFNNMGVALKDQGKLDEAIKAYKKAVSLKPDHAEAYDNMGVALKSQGKLDEAIETYKKSISLKPDYAQAYYNIGNAYRDKTKYDQAIEYYSKSISLKHDYAEAFNNIGSILKVQGEFDKSIEVFKKALSIKPDNVEASNNLGTTLQIMGNLKGSEASFRQAILWNRDCADIHQNLSLTLLNSGRLKEGLDESEWRWKTPKFLSMQRHFSKPMWDGIQSLKDKRILLWCEQGIGDTLNWSSCLSLLASQAKHCILECQDKLVPLLQRSFPNVEVKPEDRSLDKNRDDFDYHLPMGSLYRHFLSDITQNTKPKAYLVPDPDRVNYWRDRLASLGKGPYVGIAWKSSVISHYRSLHYPPISEWSPILKIPDVTFINLQYKDFEDDLAKVKEELGVTVHNFDDLDQFNNVDDVTALCAALDMAVTTKVTPMIFSSAVGTPTKIANWKQSSWNTILNNPVGPSIDIYTRNTWQTWDNVFRLIEKDIIKLNIITI